MQELGAGLFNFLNSAPLEQVREALGGMKIPEIPTPTLPKAVYADGGMVSNSSGVLIQEIRWLRKDLQEKEFVNEVYINPDKVIENADDILINSKNVSGAIRRGGTHV